MPDPNTRLNSGPNPIAGQPQPRIGIGAIIIAGSIGEIIAPTVAEWIIRPPAPLPDPPSRPSGLSTPNPFGGFTGVPVGIIVTMDEVGGVILNVNDDLCLTGSVFEIDFVPRDGTWTGSGQFTNRFAPGFAAGVLISNYDLNHCDIVVIKNYPPYGALTLTFPQVPVITVPRLATYRATAQGCGYSVPPGFNVQNGQLTYDVISPGNYALNFTFNGKP